MPPCSQSVPKRSGTVKEAANGSWRYNQKQISRLSFCGKALPLSGKERSALCKEVIMLIFKCLLNSPWPSFDHAQYKRFPLPHTGSHPIPNINTLKGYIRTWINLRYLGVVFFGHTPLLYAKYARPVSQRHLALAQYPIATGPPLSMSACDRAPNLNQGWLGPFKSSYRDRSLLVPFLQNWRTGFSLKRRPWKASSWISCKIEFIRWSYQNIKASWRALLWCNLSLERLDFFGWHAKTMASETERNQKGKNLRRMYKSQDMPRLNLVLKAFSSPPRTSLWFRGRSHVSAARQPGMVRFWVCAPHSDIFGTCCGTFNNTSHISTSGRLSFRHNPQHILSLPSLYL